ncbi:unnamed protein product, partial [Prorocentrum cordatum]
MTLTEARRHQYWNEPPPTHRIDRVKECRKNFKADIDYRITTIQMHANDDYDFHGIATRFDYKRHIGDTSPAPPAAHIPTETLTVNTLRQELQEAQQKAEAQRSHAAHQRAIINQLGKATEAHHKHEEESHRKFQRLEQDHIEEHKKEIYNIRKATEKIADHSAHKIETDSTIIKNLQNELREADSITCQSADHSEKISPEQKQYYEHYQETAATSEHIPTALEEARLQLHEPQQPRTAATITKYHNLE